MTCALFQEVIAHSHTPYLISFLLIFYYNSQLSNFFKQRKFLSQFLNIIPGDGQIYFLLSKLPSQFYPYFLNFNLVKSSDSLLFRSLVRRSCSNALTNERCSPWWSMVNSVDSGDHQKHRAATSGIKLNSLFLTKLIYALRRDQILFFLLDLLTMRCVKTFKNFRVMLLLSARRENEKNRMCAREHTNSE